MASIQPKGNKLYLVYDDPNVKNKRKQVWQEIKEDEDPQIVLAEFELKKKKGKIVAPSAETLSEFIPKFVEVYAPENWGYSMYQTSMGLIRNHIIEEIGHMKMKSITPLDIESLISRLRKKRQRGYQSYNKKESEIPYLSSKTIRDVHGLLLKIFEKAVEWKVVEESPVLCKRPVPSSKKRSAWSKNQFWTAFEQMKDDDFLHLAAHTAFVGSLRNGETMGITLDCVDLDKGVIMINKTLQRVDLEALNLIPSDELIYVFPPRVEDKGSRLVLKDPKTDNSNRIVYMTGPLKEEIRRRMEQIQREIAYHGDKYEKFDYQMLFSLPTGWPIEPKLCQKRFGRWLRGSGLAFPEIDFHGIRHTSITYKVKLSGGDFSTVMGDSGHANIESISDYAEHFFDEDRQELAQLLERAFYCEDDENDVEDRLDKLLGQIHSLVQSNPPLRNRAQTALEAILAQ